MCTWYNDFDYLFVQDFKFGTARVVSLFAHPLRSNSGAMTSICRIFMLCIVRYSITHVLTIHLQASHDQNMRGGDLRYLVSEAPALELGHS